MTADERAYIREHTHFDTLRTHIGLSRKNSFYKSEYEDAATKFNHLVSCNLLQPLLDMSRVLWDSPEWGIPKGRRHHNESDLSCGAREFYEETGLTASDIQILLNVQPLEEIYSGINDITYRHIYYFAKFISDTEIHINPENYTQTSEISAIKWLASDDVDSHIRSYHKEKAHVLKKAFSMLKHSHIFTEFVV